MADPKNGKGFTGFDDLVSDISKDLEEANAAADSQPTESQSHSQSPSQITSSSQASSPSQQAPGPTLTPSSVELPSSSGKGSGIKWVIGIIIILIAIAFWNAGTEKQKESSYVPRPEQVEKKDSRFIVNDNGTVLDKRTNLMWAAIDNGADIKWKDAKSYCEKYRGGGYKDWRMPTQDELENLYESKTYENMIKVTGWVRASETRGSKAAAFYFLNGRRYWGLKSFAENGRALPVRSVK
jgi:hypothetical protein